MQLSWIHQKKRLLGILPAFCSDDISRFLIAACTYFSRIHPLRNIATESVRPQLFRKSTCLAWAVLLCSLCACSDKEDVTGTPPTTKHPILHLYPVWSVMGDSLYYYDRGIVRVNSDGSYTIDPAIAGIWVVGADGTGSHMVLRSGQTSFSLSPDGSAAVFAVGGQIYIGVFMAGKINSSSLTQLTSQGSSRHPAWDPTGEWIAFESDYQDPGGASVVWKVRADGTELTDISRHGEGEWLMPSWNSAGSEIVHARYVTDTIFPEIFIMDGAGQNESRLTINDRMDIFPHQSPLDSLVCYESISSGVSRVMLMRLDGSMQYDIAVGMQPCWSPDGGSVAFVQAASGSSGFGTVWVVNADGSNPRQVTGRGNGYGGEVGTHAKTR